MLLWGSLSWVNSITAYLYGWLLCGGHTINITNNFFPLVCRSFLRGDHCCWCLFHNRWQVSASERPSVYLVYRDIILSCTTFLNPFRLMLCEFAAEWTCHTLLTIYFIFELLNFFSAWSWFAIIMKLVTLLRLKGLGQRVLCYHIFTTIGILFFLSLKSLHCLDVFIVIHCLHVDFTFLNLI